MPRSRIKNSKSQLYVVFKNGVIVMNHLRPAEKVVWLVEHNCFARAIYICKRLHRTREMIEVANRFAIYLWEETHQYRMAVQVWAEYILPTAPASYWELFANRLINVLVLQ